MKTYHVTEYYLASGMNGVPYTKDHGMIEAEDHNEAKDIVCNREHPDDIMYGPNNAYSTKEFMRGCLKAEYVQG